MCCSLRTVRSLRALSLLTALVTLCLVSLGRASAGAYTYSTTGQRTVNAGILLLDDTLLPADSNGNSNQFPAGRGADNKDPYVFYILNQRSDIKPFGWNIVNPLAPTSVTSNVYVRWRNRYAGAPNYDLGQTLSPSMAAYWEVPLKTTQSDDLAKFDILLLNVEQIPTITPADGEKIRRFVDGGGTLWIENTSNTGTGFPVDGLFTNLDLYFNGGTAGPAFVPSFVHSPLISSPYLLSEAELSTLGDKHISGSITDVLNGTSPPHDAPNRLVLSTVLGNTNANQPVIAAAQYGAGEIVATNMGSSNAINEYVGGVDVGVGANSGPFCGINLQVAPTADLKLVSDIIASTDSHLSEHQNSHQSGNDIGSLPSAAQVWHYPGQSQTDPSTGVVMYGHLAYMVYGNAIHAFDINPGEDLDGNGDPDDGAKDYDNGTPYDEVWARPLGGTLASAPTIAFDANNKAVVLIQQAGGAIIALNADDGATTNSFGGGPLPGSNGRGTYTTQNAPAPTYYGGRIYAGGADGSLYVYDVAANVNKEYAVDPAVVSPGGTPAPILAAPTVGIVPDSAGTVPTNDIVALCVTQNGLFSVFTGSRGELTKEAGNSGIFNTKLQPFTGSFLEAGNALSYTLNTDGTRFPIGVPTPPTPSNSFTVTPAPAVGLQLYADYDVDFANTPATVNLTRTFVGAVPQSLVTAYTGGSISTPALDRFGNVYYTVTDANGSSLYSVHDSPTPGRIHINWRFLLPKAAQDPGLDADNTSYTFLDDYQFTTSNGTATVPSAPVVDSQGNVYVLAAKSGASAILCFNGLGTVSAEATPTTGQTGVNNVSITQPVDAAGTIDEFGGSPTTLNSSQYSASTGGHIDFTNFGTNTNGPNGIHNVYPNLNEPYPVSISFSIGGGNNGVSQAQALRPMHTNLSWYTTLAVNATSGLTLVGNTLYFMEGVLNGTLYTSPSFLASVPTTPASITNKYADPLQNPSLMTISDDTLAGLTTAVPSASNGALIINGPGGVTAYTNQVTLVVDANRVVEMDSSGNAEWAVDSTSKTTLEGDTTPIYSGGAGTTPGNGQYVTTTLELNRPSSVTELTPNDYLVADTGNSRCVRFDRGGKVIWELTKFTDAFGKLKPGEPDTLNQPTSVQIRTETDANNHTLVRYLISDTGNNRIVEVDDLYDQTFKIITAANGQPEYHILNWVSHTHDVQGRDYRYQSASYYASPISGNTYVVALVTNKRIAPFTYTLTGPQTFASAAPSFLAPANQDAAGGSIVLLDYDPLNFYGSAGFGTGNRADGFIACDPNSHTLIAVSSISADLTPTGGFDLNGTLSGNGTPKTFNIRNPRYLKIVTKPVTSGGNTTYVRHYLLADDNGVWDLDGTSFQAQWGFTKADYQTVTTPINQEGVTGVAIQGGTTPQVPFSRTNIPFVPTSVQLTGTELINGTTIGRYLITNSYSQGEAANNTGDFGTTYLATPPANTNGNIPGFGGEVFEVHAAPSGGVGSALQSLETHYNPTGTPTYTGHTLSRPLGTNTSPLSQPTFAYRLQF